MCGIFIIIVCGCGVVMEDEEEDNEAGTRRSGGGDGTCGFCGSSGGTTIACRIAKIVPRHNHPSRQKGVDVVRGAGCDDFFVVVVLGVVVLRWEKFIMRTLMIIKWWMFFAIYTKHNPYTSTPVKGTSSHNKQQPQNRTTTGSTVVKKIHLWHLQRYRTGFWQIGHLFF